MNINPRCVLYVKEILFLTKLQKTKLLGTKIRTFNYPYWRNIKKFRSDIVIYALISSKVIVKNEYEGVFMVQWLKRWTCGIVVSEFKLQSHYCIHFQTNIHEKGMNPLSSQIWITTTVLLQGWIWH